MAVLNIGIIAGTISFFTGYFCGIHKGNKKNVAFRKNNFMVQAPQQIYEDISDIKSSVIKTTDNVAYDTVKVKK